MYPRVSAVGLSLIAQASSFTNFHVVKGASSAIALFRDGTKAKVAGYLGVDIAKDIVILKLKQERELAVLPVRKDPPRKGERVAAFGAPQGLNFSMSEGNVAAIRSDQEIQGWKESLGGVSDAATDATWVQTTAPISPGNSGGPLVDEYGRVVGANTWAPNEKAVGTVQNLNFAISGRDVSTLLSASSGNALRTLADLPGAAPPRAAIAGGNRKSASDGFPLVRLPSGTVLSHMIVQVPKDWPECNMTKGNRRSHA